MLQSCIEGSGCNLISPGSQYEIYSNAHFSIILPGIVAIALDAMEDIWGIILALLLF